MSLMGQTQSLASLCLPGRVENRAKHYVNKHIVLSFSYEVDLEVLAVRQLISFYNK